MSLQILQLAMGRSDDASHGDRPRSSMRAWETHVVSHEPTDDSLVLRTRAGDRDAFETLVRRYHGRLVVAATASLGIMADAEDVVQDVLLRVWINREQWTPTAGVAVYLFGAVTNRVRNVWRDRARAERSVARIGRDADNGPALADDIAEVWEVIARLPDRWRMALVLRYVRDLSFAEVGAAMRISENAAKKLVQRAVESLTNVFRR